MQQRWQVLTFGVLKDLYEVAQLVRIPWLAHAETVRLCSGFAKPSAEATSAPPEPGASPSSSPAEWPAGSTPSDIAESSAPPTLALG